MRSSGFRHVFESGSGSILPEAPLVGWTRLNRIRLSGLPTHAHAGLFEIFLIERGQVEWWVEDEVCRVPVNHIYINRPDERHGSLGRGIKPCGYFWLHVGPSAEPSLLTALRATRMRTFPASPATRAGFKMLWETHRAPPAEHAVVVARAQLHLLLAQVLADHAAADRARAARREAGKPLSFAMRRALRLIETRPGEVRSVAELAAEARLGVSQFAERFVAETGFTAAHYLRVQRIEAAKRLMREPGGRRSLAEIAHACGYSSSQHFATIFKRLEGVTPTAFLAEQRLPAQAAPRKTRR